MILDYLNRVYSLFTSLENYKEHLVYAETENSFFKFFRGYFFSFCFSISIYYLTEIYDSGFLVSILFQTIIINSLIRFFGFIFLALFNWNMKQNESSLLQYAMNDLQIIFILMIPISILTRTIYLSKFSRILITLTPVILVYFIYFIQYAKEIYEFSKWKIFLRIFSRIFILIQIPFLVLFVFFYFLGNFS